jgi:hypothetical protein
MSTDMTKQLKARIVADIDAAPATAGPVLWMLLDQMNELKSLAWMNTSEPRAEDELDTDLLIDLIRAGVDYIDENRPSPIALAVLAAQVRSCWQLAEWTGDLRAQEFTEE